MDWLYYFAQEYIFYIKLLISEPFLVMQAISLIGLLSGILFFLGNKTLFSKESVLFGSILGIVNLILSIVVSSALNNDIKPYLRNDLLFLSGFLGGWQNALVTSTLTFIGRFIFGGGNILAAAFDIFLISAFAVYARRLFKNLNLEKITTFDIFLIVCIRLVIVVLPLLILFLLGALGLSPEQTLKLITTRIVNNFSLSTVTIYIFIMILRQEYIKKQKIYIDVNTFLPNLELLKKNIQGYFDKQKNKDVLVLIFIKIDNYIELIQEHQSLLLNDFFIYIGKEFSILKTKDFIKQYNPEVYSFSEQSFVIILNDTNTEKLKKDGFAQILYGELESIGYGYNVPIKMHLAINVMDIELDNSFAMSSFVNGLKNVEKTSHLQIQYFKSSITKQIQLESWIHLKINEWIVNEEAPLWFQPKMSLATMKCNGAEALLRVQEVNPLSGEYISPLQVLLVAEKYHLLIDLDIAVIKTVVAYAEKLLESYDNFKLSVNISPITLTKPGFAHEICKIIDKKNIPPKSIVIEITEALHLSTNSDTVQDNILIISKCGINLSLDDFGTGYSSISLFSKLPFNELKLDYSMISNMNEPRTSAAILMSADGAKRYGANIVAEGIESFEQCQKLIDIGITDGQGYLFSKAIPFEYFKIFFLKYSQEPYSCPNITNL